MTRGFRQILSLSLMAAIALVAPSSSLATDPGYALDAEDGLATKCAQPPCHPTVSTIAFVSTRDNPTYMPAILAAEVYLIDADGANPRRLTQNLDGDGFPVLSPDGRKIVFDSNRLRAEGELLTSDMFLMDTDGSDQAYLSRGSSGSWSPDSKNIAFHRSASGTGQPIRNDPGAPPSDSDIFVMNVDDVLNGVEGPRNLTDDAARIDDDADWSPDGQRIAFTSQIVGDNPANPTSAEIYLMNVEGTGERQRLTDNAEEERSPDWSPNGSRLVFSCRRGDPAPGSVLPTFEICVMNADGTAVTRLTSNTLADLSPAWSPDGDKIAFQRPVAGRIQVWTMDPDGTDQQPLTSTAGINLSPNWGVLMVVPASRRWVAEPFERDHLRAPEAKGAARERESGG